MASNFIGVRWGALLTGLVLAGVLVLPTSVAAQRGGSSGGRERGGGSPSQGRGDRQSGGSGVDRSRGDRGDSYSRTRDDGGSRMGGGSPSRERRDRTGNNRSRDSYGRRDDGGAGDRSGRDRTSAPRWNYVPRDRSRSDTARTDRPGYGGRAGSPVPPRPNGGGVVRPGPIGHGPVDYHDTYFQRYFRHGFGHYSHYAPVLVFGFGVLYSPYYVYGPVCPPYIYGGGCFGIPPLVVYVEVPVYDGEICRGYPSDGGYYLENGLAGDVPGLEGAIDGLRDAFRANDPDALIELTDPDVKIAVYIKGKYQYSVTASDYLDMTRDALANMTTTAFDLYRVHRRAEGVYVVSGKHQYRDQDGNAHTVYVSYVLERVHDRWTITQVGSAPDRIREP